MKLERMLICIKGNHVYPLVLYNGSNSCTKSENKASWYVLVGCFCEIFVYVHYTFAAARPVISGYGSQFVQQGQRTSVRCIISGNPTPIVHWQLDGQPLYDRNYLTVGDFRSPSGDVVSYVNISRVTLLEGGDYVCMATNEAGATQHLSRLNVYGKIPT